MGYFITFLEGIITFISPCMLPMLPIYVSYFSGGGKPGEEPEKALINAIGFVLGFTMVFVTLGAFAGALGYFLRQYETLLHIITGGIVILFGLNYLGIIKIPFLHRTFSKDNGSVKGFFSAFVFGVVFSVGWTPCVSVFLASALMMASQQGSVIQGVFLLLCYSLGLGLPFILSALLIEKLKNAFAFLKEHYRPVNMVSGVLLIVIGIMMMTGFMERFLSLLAV